MKEKRGANALSAGGSCFPSPQSKIHVSHTTRESTVQSLGGDVWVIANPIAGGRGGRRRLEQGIDRLKSKLSVREVRWTRQRGDAETWAREAVERHAALLIGGGGDGTLNEIANALTGTEIPLGILPVGTANVVACELNVPLDPVRAARALLDGTIERIHLGCAEYRLFERGRQPTPDNPQPAAGNRTAKRCFLFAAGIGFDASVCHRINPRFKHWGKKAAYVIEGFRLFLTYTSPQLHVTLQGCEPIACHELVISNARSYAGRFWIAPDASMLDDHLDVCLFRRPGRWNLLRYAWGILRGRHPDYPDVEVHKAKSIQVRADNPACLHLDGDTLGTLPVRFSLLPDALSVVVPSR